jgi:hypothetical protein
VSWAPSADLAQKFGKSGAQKIRREIKKMWRRRFFQVAAETFAIFFREKKYFRKIGGGAK